MEETVHLVTNRNLLSEKEAKVRFGDTYNRLGPHQLRYGEARVRVPPEAKRRFGDGHARVAAELAAELGVDAHRLQVALEERLRAPLEARAARRVEI